MSDTIVMEGAKMKMKDEKNEQFQHIRDNNNNNNNNDDGSIKKNSTTKNNGVNQHCRFQPDKAFWTKRSILS